MILFSGVTEYSDRKVIILPRYSIPRLPLSNAVVVCYGRVHCRIQSWIPGSVLFRLTVIDAKGAVDQAAQPDNEEQTQH